MKNNVDWFSEKEELGLEEEVFQEIYAIKWT